MTTWTRHLYEHDPLAIAKGESNDYEPRNIFGYNANVGTSFIPLWENNTAYTQPTTGLTMTVTSNVTDNGVVIRIIGLDIKAEHPKKPHITLRNNFKKDINACSADLMIKIKEHLN